MAVWSVGSVRVWLQPIHPTVSIQLTATWSSKQGAGWGGHVHDHLTWYHDEVMGGSV